LIQTGGDRKEKVDVIGRDWSRERERGGDFDRNERFSLEVSVGDRGERAPRREFC